LISNTAQPNVEKRDIIKCESDSSKKKDVIPNVEENDIIKCESDSSKIIKYWEAKV